jgi:hypothetical protein
MILGLILKELQRSHTTLLMMNAPEVWDLGYTGQDIVVAILDTGVNYNHNDIKNNMWEHPDYPFHGWNFVNNTNNPMDDHILGGHGTHVAGTVAGDGTSGSQTGVAPGAKIMALKVLNSFGGGSESNVWNALQFGIDNEADVLNLSLGWLHANNPNRTVWRNTFDNVLAAGIISSVAAGNEGNQLGQYPVPDNVRTPGDVPPPWLHPDQTLIGGTSSVMSIGATDINDQIANFSSHGPVTWQDVAEYNDYPHNPEMGLIRPDVVAPGDNIKSLSRTNNSGYNTMSGTSMAAPGAAGVMALLLSKNPDLTPAQICQILEENTLVLEPGKNNLSGSGRLDALAAINATPTTGVMYHAHHIDDSQGYDNGSINPGELIFLTVDIINEGSSAVNNITVELSSRSAYIHFIDSIASYGDIGPGQVIGVENAFSFDVADSIPDNHRIHFEVLCSDGEFAWESEFFIYANSPNLILRSLALNDYDGNLDGLLDPGESATIFLNALNDGQFEAINASATLSTEYLYVYIENEEYLLDVVAPSDSIESVFNITLLPGAEPGDQIMFNFSVDYAGFRVEKTYIIHVSDIIEDFETADLSRFDWSSRGHALWEVIVCEVIPPIDGNYAVRSGVITHNQRSELTLNYFAAQDDSIGFYLWVNSEEDADFLKFYIDNELQEEWSNVTEWEWVTFPVDAGNRIFKWEYTKNDSVSVGNDIALVDYIKLPPSSSFTVLAGADAEICAGETFQLTGHAENYKQLLWVSSGDGVFTSPNSLNSEYIPGNQDVENGSAELTLLAYGLHNTIHHALELIIVPPPVVSAGSDASICAGEVFVLEDASVENAEQITWSSSGTGSFVDPHALNTFYTPSDQDIVEGNLIITLLASGSAICDDVESSLSLSIHPLPTAMLSGDTGICYGENTALSIELTGTPPWEVLTSADEEPLIINETPYMFDVAPEQTIVYSLISVTDANMCINAGEGEATVTVAFIPSEPAMPAAPDTVDYAYNTSTVFMIDEVEHATAYIWSIEPDQAGSITGNENEANVDWANNFQGKASVSVIAMNHCGESAPSEIKEVYLKNTIGIDHKDAITVMKVFPNPGNGMFTIEMHAPQPVTVDLRIIDLLGKVVYTRDNLNFFGKSSYMIDPGPLNEGVYLVSVFGKQGIINKKLIIRK